MNTVPWWPAMHAVLGIRRYVQLHTLPGSLNDALAASRQTPEAYDGVAELWFDDADTLANSAGSGEGMAAAAELARDEERFIDHSRSPLFVAEEHPVFSSMTSWIPGVPEGANEFSLVFGLRPNLFSHFQDFYARLWDRAVMDPVVLELCRLRVAGLLGCDGRTGGPFGPGRGRRLDRRGGGRLGIMADLAPLRRRHPGVPGLRRAVRYRSGRDQRRRPIGRAPGRRLRPVGGPGPGRGHLRRLLPLPTRPRDRRPRRSRSW